MNRLMLSSLLVVLWLSACAAPKPLPQSPIQTPASTSQSPLPTLATIPTPKADRAVVTGFLLVGANQRPATGAILYLASVQEAGGTPVMVSVDRTSMLRAKADATGRFLFADVPPGRYGLIIDKGDSFFLLKNPANNSDMLFLAKPGQLLDTSKLAYPSLPGFAP